MWLGAELVLPPPVGSSYLNSEGGSWSVEPVARVVRGLFTSCVSRGAFSHRGLAARGDNMNLLLFRGGRAEEKMETTATIKSKSRTFPLVVAGGNADRHPLVVVH